MTETFTAAELDLVEPGPPATGEERVKEILALAHTGKEADQAKYAELQPELLELTARDSGQAEARVAPAEPARRGNADLAAIDKQIEKIVRLAHSENPAHQREYPRQQGELQRLIGLKLAAQGQAEPKKAATPTPGRKAQVQARIDQIFALLSTDEKAYAAAQEELENLLLERDHGFPARTAAEREAARHVSKRADGGVPAAAVRYVMPMPADGTELSDLDKTLWSEAHKVFEDAGFSQRQVDAVAEALERASAIAEAEREREAVAVGENRAAETREALVEELGDEKAADDALTDTNAFLRMHVAHVFGDVKQMRKNLLNRRLADGSVLGDDLHFVRLIVAMKDAHERLAEYDD